MPILSLLGIAGVEWLYIIAGASAVGYATFFIIKVAIKKKRNKVHKEKVEANLDVKDDVRYTMETNPVAKNEENQATGTTVNATYQQKDIMLLQHTPVTVSKDSELKPGKYILLSTDENQQDFNIRVGVYVRSYKHNQEIVLAEGDTICAVSCNVLLR